MRGTKILVALLLALGLAAALAPAAEAQTFFGEHCWTVGTVNNPPALARFGVTNTGGPYYLLQGYVTGVPNGVPILFGSGIFVGGNLYLNFTSTKEKVTGSKTTAQMQGVLDGTTLNGSMWDLGMYYDSANPTEPFSPYLDSLHMTYNPSCAQP
jgi:hypothetical protein